MTISDGLMQAAAKIKTIDADREAEKVRLDILLTDISNRCEVTAPILSAKIRALEHSGPVPEVILMVPRPPARVRPAFASLTRRDGR